jgi:hypothetical protein
VVMVVIVLVMVDRLSIGAGSMVELTLMTGRS